MQSRVRSTGLVYPFWLIELFMLPPALGVRQPLVKFVLHGSDVRRGNCNEKRVERLERARLSLCVDLDVSDMRRVATGCGEKAQRRASSMYTP